jgi:hypothetical protein
VGNVSSAIQNDTMKVRFQDKEHRSVLIVTKAAKERGIHIDVEYKKDGIYPRHAYYPNGRVEDVIKELSRKDKQFEIGDGGDYVVEVLKDLLYTEEEEATLNQFLILIIHP